MVVLVEDRSRETTRSQSAQAVGSRHLALDRALSKRILDLQTLKGVHPRSAATVLARATSQAGQSETPTYKIFPARTWSSSARIASSTGVSRSRAWTQ